MIEKEKIIELMKSAGIKDEQIEKLDERGYFRAPAASKHHLAVEGGLAQHSYNVAIKLCELTSLWKISWKRPEGPTIVGLLHDLVKMDVYEQVHSPNGDSWRWNDRERWGDRHGRASILIAEEIGIKLEDDELDAIMFHMGTFHVGVDYLKNAFNGALKRNGEVVLATHFADWWSSEIVEKEGK